MNTIEMGDTWYTVAAKLLRASLDPDALPVSTDPLLIAQQATAAALLAVRDELTATKSETWHATYGRIGGLPPNARIPCPACGRYCQTDRSLSESYGIRGRAASDGVKK